MFKIYLVIIFEIWVDESLFACIIASEFFVIPVISSAF